MEQNHEQGGTTTVHLFHFFLAIVNSVYTLNLKITWNAFQLYLPIVKKRALKFSLMYIFLKLKRTSGIFIFFGHIFTFLVV